MSIFKHSHFWIYFRLQIQFQTRNWVLLALAWIASSVAKYTWYQPTHDLVWSYRTMINKLLQIQKTTHTKQGAKIPQKMSIKHCNFYQSKIFVLTEYFVNGSNWQFGVNEYFVNEINQTFDLFEDFIIWQDEIFEYIVILINRKINYWTITNIQQHKPITSYRHQMFGDLLITTLNYVTCFSVFYTFIYYI